MPQPPKPDERLHVARDDTFFAKSVGSDILNNLMIVQVARCPSLQNYGRMARLCGLVSPILPISFFGGSHHELLLSIKP